MCVAVVPRKRGWQKRNFTGIPQPFKATPNPPQIRHDQLTIRPLGLKNTADMKSPGQAQLTNCNPALGLELVERIIPRRGVGPVIAAAWGDHEQYVGCHFCLDLVKLLMPNPFLVKVFHLNEPKEVHNSS